MFTLTEATCTLAHFNVRTEKHGEKKRPAADLKIALAGPNTPPAEAVTDAMADAAMRQMRAVCGSNRITREQMWAIIDAALASKDRP